MARRKAGSGKRGRKRERSPDQSTLLAYRASVEERRSRAQQEAQAIEQAMDDRIQARVAREAESRSALAAAEYEAALAIPAEEWASPESLSPTPSPPVNEEDWPDDALALRRSSTTSSWTSSSSLLLTTSNECVPLPSQVPDDSDYFRGASQRDDASVLLDPALSGDIDAVPQSDVVGADNMGDDGNKHGGAVDGLSQAFIEHADQVLMRKLEEASQREFGLDANGDEEFEREYVMEMEELASQVYFAARKDVQVAVENLPPVPELSGDMSLRVIASAFNGIGGILLGAFMAGFTVDVLLAWEIDEAAERVMQANFGPHARDLGQLMVSPLFPAERLQEWKDWCKRVTVVSMGDVEAVGAVSFETVMRATLRASAGVSLEEASDELKRQWLPRLVVGGSPCDDLSILNRERLGLKGKRSSLFQKLVDLRDNCVAGARSVGGAEPLWMLENVASMPKSDREQLETTLGVPAYVMEAGEYGPVLRARLYFCSWLVVRAQPLAVTDVAGRASSFLQPRGSRLVFPKTEAGPDKAHCITTGVISANSKPFTGAISAPRYNRVARPPNGVVYGMSAYEAETLMGFPGGFVTRLALSTHQQASVRKRGEGAV